MDFHSFRVTFVTLALAQGVPVEVVRKLTGHDSIEVVLDNYFQPNSEHFRVLLRMNMPSVLAGTAKTRDEMICEILTRMTLSSWEKDRERLLTFFRSTAQPATQPN